MISPIYTQTIFFILLFIFILYGSWAFLFIFASFFNVSSNFNSFPKRLIRKKSPYTNHSNNKISIIIPCKNEEDVIIRTLNAVKKQDYPLHQVIIVDDNSQDNTYHLCQSFIEENVLENFFLFKRTKIDSNKAKAVNNALNLVDGDIVVLFDADNYPEKNCIQELVNRFNNPEVGVVQGRIISRVHNLISKIVFMERASGFNVRFLGKEVFNLNCQFGGTAVAIRKNLLDDLGGFNENSLTEDTDITARVIASGYHIVYQPLAMVKEETPPNINNYISQRTRWATGHMNCFLENFKTIITSSIPLKRKLDALLFLFYYFVPIFCGLGMIFGLLTYHFYTHIFLNLGNIGILVIILCLTPIIEILVGTLRSDNKKYILLMPLMIFFFILNIFICFNGIFNLIKGNKKWIKTERFQINRNTNRGTISIIFASIMTIFIVSASFIIPLTEIYAEKISSPTYQEQGSPLIMADGMVEEIKPLRNETQCTNLRSTPNVYHSPPSPDEETINQTDPE